jgi:dTDP-4-amino-4,6-dideoxygalactose transaminase
MRKSFLIFGSPRIEEEEIQEVVDCLRSGWIGSGPKVNQFEEMFRSYIGAQNAVAVHSCTAALHLSMLVSGIGQDDEVITTPMTFAATANAIIHTGATPVFADINRTTLNIDPIEVKRKVSPATKAILPVHFAGRACDMKSILNISEGAGLVVINDAAHAIETEYEGKKIGVFGNMTAYSFYVTKNIVTGEGGMVVTADKELADKIRMYALHGMSKDAWKRFSDSGYKHYEVVFPGYKYNMMDIQAALGIHQLKRIEQYARRRHEIWQRYNEAFHDLAIFLPSPIEPNTRHSLHLYTLLLDIENLDITRDQFIELMYNNNIGTGVHYTALHLHPYYRDRFGFQRGDFPNAEFISDRTVSIPLSAKLTDEDVQDVIASVREIILSHTKGL